MFFDVFSDFGAFCSNSFAPIQDNNRIFGNMSEGNHPLFLEKVAVNDVDLNKDGKVPTSLKGP